MTQKEKIRGNCWKCGQELSEFEYGRQDSCPKCGWDTHVCKNCGFYDTRLNNECRENQADRVLEKERGNFCDYFKATSSVGSGDPSAQDLKSAAEALFGKKP